MECLEINRAPPDLYISIQPSPNKVPIIIENNVFIVGTYSFFAR
jgi:hypothetical protein